MKSFIILAAVCVVAAVAIEPAPEALAQYQQMVDMVKQGMEECTRDIQISEADAQKYFLGQENNVEEQVAQAMACGFNSAGMMDNNEMRAEKMCQLAQRSFGEEVGDAACEMVQQCANIDGEAGDVAIRFFACMVRESLTVCRKGIQA